MKHTTCTPIHFIGRGSGNEIRGRKFDLLVQEEGESLYTSWSGHRSASCCHGGVLDPTAFSGRGRSELAMNQNSSPSSSLHTWYVSESQKRS